jgi:hypothetical protein
MSDTGWIGVDLDGGSPASCPGTRYDPDVQHCPGCSAASSGRGTLSDGERKTVEKVRRVLGAIESDTATEAALAQLLAIIDRLLTSTAAPEGT